jgi:hypothetical protein
VGAGVAALYFQNCSPTQFALPDHEDESGTVEVIENFRRGIRFVQPATQVRASATEHAVFGFCERKSRAVLDWELTDEGEGPLDRGRTVCDGGGFRIELRMLAKLQCFSPYVLRIRGPDGRRAEMIVTRRCEARQRSRMPAMGDQDCFLELHDLTSGAGQSPRCSRVCYSAGEVTLEQVEASSVCAGQ